MQRDDQKAKLSYTAITVAQATLACHEMPEWAHLVEPRTAAILRHFVNVAMPALPFGKDYLSLAFIKHSYNPIRKFTYNRAGCIAYPQHMAMRKLFLETQVREAIKAGVKQVLIIGGGFDTLALRLHKEFPQVHFIEADRGETREVKLKALATLGNVLPEFKERGANLHYLECDLSQPDWPQFLQNQGYFSAQSDSVVIAEGLIPYLTAGQTNSLFTRLRENIMTAKSQLLVGFAGPNTGIAKALADMLLEESGETFQFLIGPNQVAPYCSAVGFTISARAMSADLQRLAGNEDLIAYKDELEKFAPEHYFILEKTPGWMQNNPATFAQPREVKDIPIATVSIPERHQLTETCVIS